jgi:hypothetical protein
LRIASISKNFVVAACAAVALAVDVAHAQLDLGSGDIPQNRIDAYMEPFYKVIASGIGAGRFFPGSPGFGYEVGAQADFVPLPDEKPFASVKLSTMPFFRARAGFGYGGASVMARGLEWNDPRIGDLSTFGAGISYGRAWGNLAVPLAATLMAGWDVLEFSSTYTYKYRGSVLGLFDQDIPGDYTLLEHIFAGGAMLSVRHGAWRGFLQSWFERASGHFSYLYLDPRDSKTHEVSSDLGLPGFRAAAGACWHGIRLEAGWRSYPYFEASLLWVH